MNETNADEIKVVQPKVEQINEDTRLLGGKTEEYEDPETTHVRRQRKMNAGVTFFCFLFLIFVCIVMNIILFVLLRHEDIQYVIIYGELIGFSFIFILPSFIISCIKSKKGAKIAAIISLGFVILGMVGILLGMCMMSTTMEAQEQKMFIDICGIICLVAYLVRVIYLYLMYFRKPKQRTFKRSKLRPKKKKKSIVKKISVF